MSTASGDQLVLVAEDVWSPAFAALAEHLPLQRLKGVVRATDPQLPREATALVVRNRTEIDATLLRALPRLQIVARAGTGLDNIDLGAADAAGVVVSAAPGVNAQSVGEHTLALALALARDVCVRDRKARSGLWDRTPGLELHGKTWGIIGVGRTGRAVARVIAGFDLSIVGYDPYIDPADPELAAVGVTLTDLDSLLASVDVLSVHVPLTDETRGMVGRRLLASCKPGVLLINVARGPVVDEQALGDALRSGRVAGAGLDVRVEEPPRLGALEALGNVVLSPHVAGLTQESQERIARILSADIEAVLGGGNATHAVGGLGASARTHMGATR